MTAPVLVFDANPVGHRENYVRGFARLLGGTPLIGHPLGHLWRLLTARRLMLPTFETMPRGYVLLALARMMLMRRTVILILRPQIGPGQWVKRSIHQLLAAMPGVRLGTIFPISPESHLYGRSSLILDLEYWDRTGMAAPAATPLSDAVRAAAAGRKIVAALGWFSADKGGHMLIDLAQRPDLAEKFLFVLTGIVLPDVQDRLDAAPRHALFTETRELSDDELMSLYPAADLVWCCYSPERDISSGIFGRSLQFGVPAIVREGSLLQRQAEGRAECIAVPWGDSEAAAQRISQWAQTEATRPATSSVPFNEETELRKLRKMLDLEGAIAI